MLNDASWWQVAGLLVALAAALMLYFGRGRLPWWASGLAGALVALGGYLALFVRRAPNSPPVEREAKGADAGASRPQEAKQRPNEALEEVEYEADKLGAADDAAGVVLDLGDGADELADWRARAERDGF